VALASAGKPLPRFQLAATLRARMKFESAELKCDNVIGVLPGSDAELSKEYVVVSAHLDGYGVGEPWNGDRIYNGTFDDAAYVATLIDLAEKLHASGKRLKRSLLFAVVTGKRRACWGRATTWRTPTVPKERMVPTSPRPVTADLPLEDADHSGAGRLHAGRDGAASGRTHGDQDTAGPEPERNLLRRSDHWNFMQIECRRWVSFSATRTGRRKRPFTAAGTWSDTTVRRTT